MRTPTVARRLLAHELRAAYSLALWMLRRRHGVGAGALAAAYTGPQTAMMWGFVFVSVIETIALAVLIPWPLAHTITLIIDVYGVLLLVAMQAACVTRPHVVGADGSLRIRYGALFDLRIRPEDIVHARVDRRFPDGRLVQPREDGSLDLIVAGQTTVDVELAGPVAYVRPLGRTGSTHTIRFHADDPKALVAALAQARLAREREAEERKAEERKAEEREEPVAQGAALMRESLMRDPLTRERTAPSPAPGRPA